MKLTPKQKKFADEYIKTGNIEKSALYAGYSKSYSRANSHKLLANVGVKLYIEKRMKQIESEAIMDSTEAVKLLTSIARGELMETVVVGTPVGAETVEKEADIKTRISAIKEILKRYPGNDKLVEQQIRKMSAEADIAEKKVDMLSGSDGEITININPFREDI
ncbi:terminase small subunit [Leuconostoc mesenteroides]|uniref:terminase small subunit n=1 Tax=Leuconostoc mesenteroides TaxID=1245 RepID=UPI003859A82F